MIDEIEEFIKRRFTEDCHWLDGNCYYFAVILRERFPSLKIYYLPIAGHFVAGDGLNYYDFTGRVDLQEDPESLEYIEEYEYEWYLRLMDYCKM